MSNRKTHIRDIRLFTNAGMAFPVCRSHDKLLNVEIRVEFAKRKEEATCKRCVSMYKKDYPWATWVAPESME